MWSLSAAAGRGDKLVEAAARGGRAKGDEASQRNAASGHFLGHYLTSGGILPEQVAEAVLVDVFGTGQCPADCARAGHGLAVLYGALVVKHELF